MRWRAACRPPSAGSRMWRRPQQQTRAALTSCQWLRLHRDAAPCRPLPCRQQYRSLRTAQRVRLPLWHQQPAVLWQAARLAQLLRRLKPRLRPCRTSLGPWCLRQPRRGWHCHTPALWHWRPWTRAAQFLPFSTALGWYCRRRPRRGWHRRPTTRAAQVRHFSTLLGLRCLLQQRRARHRRGPAPEHWHPSTHAAQPAWPRPPCRQANASCHSVYASACRHLTQCRLQHVLQGLDWLPNLVSTDTQVCSPLGVEAGVQEPAAGGAHGDGDPQPMEV